MADIEKLNAEYNAVIARCAEEQEKLRAARLVALAAIGPARDAMAKHEAAIRAAQKARQDAETAAADARRAAEQLAEQQERDALDAADENLRRHADDRGRPADPEGDRRRAVEAADAAYQARLREIDRGPGDPQKRASQREDASAIRDAAINKVEAAYREATEDATFRRDEAYAAAREKHIREVIAARQAEEAARARAQSAFERARADAHDQLNVALRGIPAAAEIEREFQARQQALLTQCEAEKAAILTRLRG
jgi:colicin import membrane protein